MKNKLVFSALLLLPFFSNAQHLNPKSMATFGLINSFLNQRWNFGYMHQLNERIWIGTDLGFGSKGTVLPPVEDVLSYKSYEVRPAVYYSLRPESKLKHFLGAEFFHISTEMREDFFHFWDNEEYYWADAATTNRTKTGGNLTYSILLHGDKSRIAFMPKIGVGLRNLQIKYSDAVGLSQSVPPKDGFPLLSMAPREGTRFNLDFDIKLVVKF